MTMISSRSMTYCTNIHPCDDWEGIFAALQVNIPIIKAAVSPEYSFPIGLRLSQRAAFELGPKENETFSAWLREHDCYIPSLNGFSYGSFHGMPVKEQVYLPDWRSPDRTAYTIRLADHLAQWLPDGICGSISTVPIGFKGKVSYDDLPAVRKQIVAVLSHFEKLRQSRGKEIILALEPEPGCLLETTEEVCRFFELIALPMEIRSLIGICYDCCHQAVEFEDPKESLVQLKQAEIRLAKVQVSSALNLVAPSLELLDRFDEPCYLHQIIIRDRYGKLHRYRDLPDARTEHISEIGDEWRCHFHVPIFISNIGECDTTRFFLETILPLLSPTVLLEVETYTWSILPHELRHESVTESIIRELRWLEAQILGKNRCN